MAGIRGREVWLLLLGVVLLGGCGKQVSLTFFNLTGDMVDVYVTTPVDGRKNIGLVPPMGNLRYDVMIPTKLLPAACSWQTGSFSHSFTVSKDTDYRQKIDILPLGKPQMKDRDASLKDELERDINPFGAEPPGGP